MMRALALLALLVACDFSDGDCTSDGDCSGSKVCARNGECLAPSDVHFVRVSWTIRGQAASATSCAATPDFYLLFASNDPGDVYGYEPVPCAAGVFTVDKLPSRYVSVEIGQDGGFSQQAVFDSQGHASFDLMP